jgi:hypothetical protein
MCICIYIPKFKHIYLWYHGKRSTDKRSTDKRSTDKRSKIEIRQKIDRQKIKITKRSKDPKDRNFPEILQLQLAFRKRKKQTIKRKIA